MLGIQKPFRAWSQVDQVWRRQWRYRIGPREDWRLKKRRLGLAWQEQDRLGVWRKRDRR